MHEVDAVALGRKPELKRLRSSGIQPFQKWMFELFRHRAKFGCWDDRWVVEKTFPSVAQRHSHIVDDKLYAFSVGDDPAHTITVHDLPQLAKRPTKRPAWIVR